MRENCFAIKPFPVPRLLPRHRLGSAAALFVLGLALAPAHAGDEESLRLVPFPKEVKLARGAFPLNAIKTLAVDPAQRATLAAELQEELKRVKVPLPLTASASGESNVLRLLVGKTRRPAPPLFRTNATAEDYSLQITPDAATVTGAGPAGLAHGVRTLRQMIRANRAQQTLPCLTIRDWPSLRWRAFQDDLTRGPSSTLANLKLQAELGAFLKLNVFTYYMEYQYAFSRHPVIGPKDGSLTPEDLRGLLEFARPLHLEVLGNQQSFGHFTAILAHPEYAALRETEYLLCPTNERTYALLDDLYAEVIPLLPFAYFNVCCDETDGLGQGPSKPEAERLGVGGLYVQHIRRLHDLVTGKYGKRMMMWGDIILRHPDKLAQVPADVVMLVWGYDPRPSFADAIRPFAQSGHQFWVCPGVNCWSRVLPDFGAAITNIQNFVRDGVKLGATGMLNTAWDDDGENFNAPNWHGIAWGAECAWNGAATPYPQFRRRVGAVLFGEQNAHFGRVIDLLSAPGIGGLPNAEFWKPDLGPIKVDRADRAIARWHATLSTVREAIEELQAAQKEAVANAGLLDFFLFGARRLETYALSHLDTLEAAIAYRSALRASSETQGELVDRAEKAIRRSRQQYETLRGQFIELWHRENRPYALEWTLKRYDAALARHDLLLKQLGTARASAVLSQPLPPAKEVGLDLVETNS
jgi:hypothetical protein